MDVPTASALLLGAMLARQRVGHGGARQDFKFGLDWPVLRVLDACGTTAYAVRTQPPRG